TSSEKTKKRGTGPRLAWFGVPEPGARGLLAFSFREKTAESLRRSSRCHNQGAFLALVAAEMELAILSARGSGCRGDVLEAQHLDRLDGRRLGKQVRRFRHQRLGDRAIQMRLTTCLVLERIEDAEGARRESQREPDGRGLFVARHGEAGLE